MSRRFFISVFTSIVVGFILFSVPVWAESGITDSTSVSVTVSTLPELQMTVSEHIIFPLLRGNAQNPLISGNNLDLGLIANITPLTVDGTIDITFTPVAFLQIIAGGTLGSGWNWPGLGDGMSLNKPSLTAINPAGKPMPERDGAPFDGLVWKAYWAGLFQFDLAALVPGDWNHVVFRTRQEWNYRAYTRASSDESWLFKADNGQNRNGFNYYASYVLGYQMPKSPVFNMVGLMAEMDLYLYDTPNRDFWGDDLGRWTFSGLFNFQITKWLGSTFLIQFRSNRNYKDNYDSVAYKSDKPFYQTRELYDDDPLRLDFYRLVLIFNFKLR